MLLCCYAPISPNIQYTRHKYSECWHFELILIHWDTSCNVSMEGRHCNLDRNDWSDQARTLHNGPLPRLAGTRTWLEPKYSLGRSGQTPSRDIHNFHFDQTTIIPVPSYRCLPAVLKVAAEKARVYVHHDGLSSESWGSCAFSYPWSGLLAHLACWPADYCLCLGRDSSIFRNFS